MIKLDRLVLNNVGPYRYEEGGNKIEINNQINIIVIIIPF